MATSSIRIKNVCEWCGKEFEAQKCTIRFCCKRCAEHAYKGQKRQERKQLTETMVLETIIRQKEEAVSHKDYLSVQETADLMGVKRNAIYQPIYRGMLKAFRLTSRVTRISRKDIEDLLKMSCYVRETKAKSSVNDENSVAIFDFYTTNEIIEKFGVVILGYSLRGRLTKSRRCIIEIKHSGERRIVTGYLRQRMKLQKKMIGYPIPMCA